MKKVLTASAITAGLLVVPAVAQANLRSDAIRLRAEVVHHFGHQAPGRDIVRWGFWTGRRARRASHAELRGYANTLERMLAPPPVVHHGAAAIRQAGRVLQQPSAGYVSGSLSDVPGVPPGFASCVAMRESTNGAGSSNIYGILPSNGYSGGMSLAAQKQLFSQMYARQGSQPWAPYDGC